MRLPFGLDASEAMELLRALENREMWASPRFGVAYTADNLNTTTAELGIGTDRWRKPEEGEGDLGTKKNPQDAVSARIAYDMSMLDGSRLVFSGYGERHGERRFGVGFLTTTAHGDTTHAEFVRKLATPVGNTEPFKQLLRLSYASNWRGNGRWVVLIDDERFRHRLGSVEYNARFLEHLKLKVSIAYLKSETGDDMRRWSLATGLEAFL